jgi:hypothetical protein
MQNAKKKKTRTLLKQTLNTKTSNSFVVSSTHLQYNAQHEEKKSVHTLSSVMMRGPTQIMCTHSIQSLPFPCRNSEPSILFVVLLLLGIRSNWGTATKSAANSGVWTKQDAHWIVYITSHSFILLLLPTITTTRELRELSFARIPKPAATIFFSLPLHIYPQRQHHFRLIQNNLASPIPHNCSQHLSTQGARERERESRN